MRRPSYRCQRLVGDALCVLTLLAVVVALIAWMPDVLALLKRTVAGPGGNQAIAYPRSRVIQAAAVVYTAGSLALFGWSLSLIVRGVDRTPIRSKWLWIVTLLMYPLWIVPYWLVHGRRAVGFYGGSGQSPPHEC